MGQRFQAYVNYGDKGDNLFAMHLQWCWGAFSVIRAHQLVSYLDAARQDKYNPFGLGEQSDVGGLSFDGRREDLYLLQALTEINTVSKSIVEGIDLMQEQNDFHEWRFKEGKISSFPSTVQIDPLAQDNNDGFLVIQATEKEVKYGFCRNVCGMEPVSAGEYLAGYPQMIDRWDDKDKAEVLSMVKDLEGYPLLTKDEMQQIFDKTYDKKLNIENYEPPKQIKRTQPLAELTSVAKDRAAQKNAERPHSTLKNHDQER